jgi:outer membrane protein assembly factor BamD (BamD/ComL family)
MIYWLLGLALLAADPQPQASPAPNANVQRRETEQLLMERARILLGAGQPKKALEVAEQIKRKYPKGMMVEAREVIAIQALCDLGRIKDASARVAQFDKSYPRSANRKKVHDLVEHPRSTRPAR